MKVIIFLVILTTKFWIFNGSETNVIDDIPQFLSRHGSELSLVSESARWVKLPAIFLPTFDGNTECRQLIVILWYVYIVESWKQHFGWYIKIVLFKNIINRRWCCGRSTLIDHWPYHLKAITVSHGSYLESVFKWMASNFRFCYPKPYRSTQRVKDWIIKIYGITSTSICVH